MYNTYHNRIRISSNCVELIFGKGHASFEFGSVYIETQFFGSSFCQTMPINEDTLKTNISH